MRRKKYEGLVGVDGAEGVGAGMVLVGRERGESRRASPVSLRALGLWCNWQKGRKQRGGP